MKSILHILTVLIVSTVFVSCNGSENQKDVQDVIIVGGDTLGKNWDNLPTKEEAEQARSLGLTPEQFMQLKDEQQKQDLLKMQQEQEAANQGNNASEESNALPPTSFSDQMYKEPTLSVETQDGREVVVGTSKPH